MFNSMKILKIIFVLGSGNSVNYNSVKPSLKGYELMVGK